MVGRSLKAVAQRAGKSQNWLSARLHGRSAISADDIYLLAKGLQCDPCDFFAPEVDAAPIPSREDREVPVDFDREHLFQRLRRVRDDERQDVEEYLEFLEWKRTRNSG